MDVRGLTNRPAPTITGGGTETGGAEPIAKYHERYTSDPGWRGSHERMSTHEAATLQSFPTEPPFQWRGSKTKVFLTIGNAVPPLLGTHILESLIFGGQEVARAYELSNLREDPYSRPEVS